MYLEKFIKRAQLGDSLTNHADGIDYTVAVASDKILEIIDSVWIEEVYGKI